MRGFIKPLRRWGLGQKLSATLCVVVFSVALTISFFVMGHEERALDAELRHRGSNIVRTLARLSLEPVLQYDLWGLHKVVRDIVRSENVVEYALVLNSLGQVLSHSDPARFPIGEPLPPDPFTNAALGADGLLVQVGRSPDGKALYDIAFPIVLDMQKLGVVRIGVTRRHLEQSLAALKRDVLLISSLLAALGIALGLVLSRRMTRPLESLSASARALSQGRLDERVRVETREKDEIGLLADSFNQMAESLQERIQEIQATKERLLKSEKLASIGEMAGAMAHEIRNPLSSIYTAVNLLSVSAGRPIGEEQLRLLRAVQEESRRLNRILSDFLRFASPRPPLLQPHDLNGLVGEVLGALRHDEAARGKALSMELDPRLGAVQVDADQLKQVLWNVVLNGLQAVEANGEVFVGTTVENGSAKILVRDNGRGIPREELSRLFEPFQSTKRDGMGLGLAIAHRIVEAHGGHIAVESEEERGTRVEISLPTLRS